MSTRSTIWVKNDDGSFNGIYCHFDGYLDGVGACLKENYTDKDKVKALVNLGSISFLEAEIDCPAGHSFESPVANYTVAYHRDRGEDYCRYYAKDVDEAKEYFEEYNYFFMDGKWLVYDNENDALEEF